MDASTRQEVLIDEQGGPGLKARLTVPPSALGIVVCLAPTGDPRWQKWGALESSLIDACHAQALATLSTEGLLPDMAQAGADFKAAQARVEDMASRLTAVTSWLLQHPDTQALSIGYFAPGAACAAAALLAVRAPDYVGAIVGVRPCLELAGDALDKLRAPLLCIETDSSPSQRLHDAIAQVKVETCIERLALARFESDLPALASHWFLRHLSVGVHSPPPVG